MSNKVTLYSNGIGHFSRVEKIDSAEPVEVQIPVNQNHIGDLLASLRVNGNVDLVSPPSYTPNSEKEALNIDINNAVRGLAMSLSGSRVKVHLKTGSGNPPHEGRLLGIHTEKQFVDGKVLETDFVSIFSVIGISNHAISQISHLEFADEVVNKEIERALERNFSQIKPNSTFVRLKVKGKSNMELQYCLPVAAWKRSYRFVMTKGLATLDGFAVIDNNTEEDWKDAIISVVTGEPTTFDTDLAESKIPQRQKVNVVDETAQGPVAVERGHQKKSVLRGAVMACSVGGGGSTTMGFDADDGGSLAQYAAGDVNLESFGVNALQANTTSQEVGDFCIFRSATPLDIGSGQSATIPIFNKSLKDAEVVLFYKPENNLKRAFRAVQFTNDTPYPLAKGVCTIYEDGEFAGQYALMETCQPKQKLTMPHALETGVNVQVTYGNVAKQRTSLKVSKSVLTTYYKVKTKTEYIITNAKEENFKFVLDYTWRLSGGHAHNFKDRVVKASLEAENDVIASETLANGERYKFDLPAGASLTLTIEESAVEGQGTGINGRLLISQPELVKGDKLKNVIKLTEQYDEIAQNLNDLRTEQTEFDTEMKRLNEHIRSDQASDKWKTRLAETDGQFCKNKDKIKKLTKDATDLNATLNKALQELEIEVAAK